MNQTIYDAVIIGGGPSGATAATDLALAGPPPMMTAS